jgi:adenylate cyclase
MSKIKAEAGSNRRQSGEPLIRGLLSAALLGLFCLHAAGIAQIRPMVQLENLAYDLRTRLTLPFVRDERIVIVRLDEQSFAREGRWPWPRERLAELVERLTGEYGARAVGLDVVLPEPEMRRRFSGTSGREMRFEELLRGPLAERLMLDSESPDDRLAVSLRGRKVVLGMEFRDAGEGGPVGQLPAPVMLGRALPPDLAPPEARVYTANLPLLADASAGAGFIDNSLLDADGSYRRAPLFRLYEAQVYPSFALELTRVAEGWPEPAVLGWRQGPGGGFSSHGLVLGDQVIAMDARTGVLVPYRSPGFGFPSISAADVLDGSAEQGLLRGRIVLVGGEGTGLGTVHRTPVTGAMSGIEVQANLVAGLLDGQVLRVPHRAAGLEMLLLLAVALLLALGYPVLGGLWSAVLSGGLLVGLMAGNLVAWHWAGIVLPVASVAVFIVVLLGFHLLHTLVTAARGRRELSRIFRQYVPRELVDELAARPGRASLAGESRRMTVLFSDIHGFASIAESLDPRDLPRLMNEFLTRMTRVIQRHRGTIDKYMGDSVMAFWGAPLEDSRHAGNATLAALAMHREMDDLNQLFRDWGWPELRLGIGINTGVMSVGNMGSEFRMAYTVMGDAVNLGARLEGLTRVYGVDTLVSQFTRDAVDGVVFVEIDRVCVRGREEPVSIYEPLGTEGGLDGISVRVRDLMPAALAAYRERRWHEAASRFRELADLDLSRGRLYRLFRDRIEYYSARPPGDHWDATAVYSNRRESGGDGFETPDEGTVGQRFG